MKITRVRQCVSKKSNRWLEVGNVVLSEEHKSIIESNIQWLDDVIINASQNLLHSICGLQETTLGNHLTFDIMKKDFVQILHNREDHWFTISTLGLPSGHVNIYDSLYQTCTDHAIDQICSIIFTPNNAVHLHFIDVDKQTNSSDCGLYAICLCYWVMLWCRYMFQKI